MKRWLIILFVISLTITLYEISDSFGLFESEREIVVNNDIGKWNILVNEESINQTTTFSVSNVTVSGEINVRENYFAPGTSGFFDIDIDPGDTDVSIYYEIVCRTDRIINPQISLTRIENVQKPDLVLVAPYTYAGVIPLIDIENGVKTKIRFHVTWTNNDNNNEIDSLYGNSSSTFDIPMSITFRQYTGETISPVTPTPVPTATPEPTSTPTIEPTPASGE